MTEEEWETFPRTKMRMQKKEGQSKKKYLKNDKHHLKEKNKKTKD